MGNEHSNHKELSQNGKAREKSRKISVNGVTANIKFNGVGNDVDGETVVHQNGEPFSLILATESPEPDFVIVESDCQPAEAEVISEVSEAIVHMAKLKKGRSEKVSLLDKMFKKKAEPPVDVESVQQAETSNEDQTDVSPPAAEPQPETATANLKQESDSLTEPESGVTLEQENAAETFNGNSEPEENQEESHPEDNPVMNFFKTLVTPTKTSKKESATPEAAKDQSQKETQPAATTTAAQISEPPAAPKGMSIPPPPPPEPPKMEIKGEPAAKPAKPTPKEEPKAAAKESEPSKGKSAKDTLSSFFRPKTIKEAPPPAVQVEETPVEAPEPVVEVQSENKVEPQATAEEATRPVVEEQMVDGAPEPVQDAEKVDPSKTGTLEAAAKKPEPPPPVQEEKKKTASKSPSFLSFFKPKAAVPKKAAAAAAAAAAPAAEAPQTVKANKEEPKAAAKSSEVVADNKQASLAPQAGDDGASVPRKLEKRNSIHLFFKTLGQKRHSTDAGVQTEPAAAAAAAEKAK
ncbi:breast carcinoma-amplified sequence 1 isoform X2 [Scophthalmus maximus]|uniref:breast carcinoma-amplified sequence 1 isoform X2 n=1 Tax=Scophthalmus maximus TaxID=52904 RepID=UPI001FA8825A|nr:breast carcinoma-amplified sequence 1 isoform X2 [Scophthalmus maximus]